MCEKVTVEIQIHEHSAILSLWDFFCPLCDIAYTYFY